MVIFFRCELYLVHSVVLPGPDQLGSVMGEGLLPRLLALLELLPRFVTVTHFISKIIKDNAVHNRNAYLMILDTGDTRSLRDLFGIISDQQ